METLLIEVRDQKGMDLLRYLEALQLIRVIDKKAPLGSQGMSINPTNGVISAKGADTNLASSSTRSSEKRKAADRFAGKLSTETAERLDQHIQQSRVGWERI